MRIQISINLYTDSSFCFLSTGSINDNSSVFSGSLLWEPMEHWQSMFAPSLILFCRFRVVLPLAQIQMQDNVLLRIKNPTDSQLMGTRPW